MDNSEKELQLGTMVANGRTVIAMTKMQPKVIGDSYAYWVTICFDANAYHPYAVRDVVARPEGWSCGNGDYFANLTESQQRYYERGGDKNGEIIV